MGCLPPHESRDCDHRMTPPEYRPDRADDQFDANGIKAEADVLAKFVTSPFLSPPLSLGVFGAAGSGRTFFLQRVARRIGDASN